MACFLLSQPGHIPFDRFREREYAQQIRIEVSCFLWSSGLVAKKTRSHLEEIAGETQSKFTLPTQMMLHIVKGTKEVKPCVAYGKRVPHRRTPRSKDPCVNLKTDVGHSRMDSTKK
jgi:hypothetical protein